MQTVIKNLENKNKQPLTKLSDLRWGLVSGFIEVDETAKQP